jgi:general secretion pathway protein A
MMYRDFYGLKSAPFQITPDPTFFFVSASHKAALDVMTAGIATRQGVVAITGVSGVGKTTLVRTYLARVAPPQLTTIVLWQAHCSFLEILTLMARRFAVPVTTDAPETLRTQMQQRLRQECRQGHNVALIIDEAQHLPRETIERVLELTDLTPSGAHPLQLVLVGQPALQQHLRTWARSRVGPRRLLHATIRPLTPAERVAYIRQRVARVAGPGGPIFTPEALTTLVRHSGGVPRDVNLLCANVLEAGFQAQQQPITADLVQQVRATCPGAQPFPLGWRALAATAGLVLMAGLLWAAPFHTGPHVPRHSPAAPPRPQSEALLPMSAPPLVSLSLPPPQPAPQAREDASLGRTVGPDPGERHVYFGQVESRQRLESPPTLPRALPTSRGTAVVRGTTRPPHTMGITSPRHGDTVGQKITVEGVLAGLRPEHQVFVCVQSQAFGRLIYPQGQVIPDGTGQWTVTSMYATPGYRYATFLVRTTDTTAAARLRAPHARKYGMQDLPPNTERLGPAIVVMRE